MKVYMIFDENKSVDIVSKLSCSVPVNLYSFDLKLIYVVVSLLMTVLHKFQHSK